MPESTLAAPTFVICSLPRCGSTALFRVLTAGAATAVLYEPDLAPAPRDTNALRGWCQQMLAAHRGIKHVWDPNGWPFDNPMHQSTLERLDRSPTWVPLNRAVLDAADKVLLLRRRHRLARVISDLLGQHTDLWGHRPEQPHSPQEAKDYQQQVSRMALAPLDEEVIAWYVERATAWEDAIVSGLGGNCFRLVFYEDLFGVDVDTDTRVERVTSVAGWLGVDVRSHARDIREIVSPDSKLNSAALYERIPNLGRIIARFGAL